MSPSQILGREQFLSHLSFKPDDFQIQAFNAVDANKSVLVAAPTGSGKTLVAEYAVSLSLTLGKRAFYTAPVKALSNQKYRDLCEFYGDARVGLLTGDNSINPNAEIVVMTTEVLRNMIYADSEDLEQLHCVVLDEVHFLQDSYRGPVWEEVIIHLPQNVLLVCLSATVSNAQEIADWMTTVRGATEVVVETKRPVPLECLYAALDRANDQLLVEPVLIAGEPNQHLRRLESQVVKRGQRTSHHRNRLAAPSREEIIDHLSNADLLPAIYFIFSRAQCDEAARVVLNSGFRFTTDEDKEAINNIIDTSLIDIPDDDLEVLEFDKFHACLLEGITSHHAGLIPPFKEIVEQCFLAGLIKVVFATETLAVGINMPARAVVIEKVTKYKGEHHVALTPSEFTQLTGRAGRRGLDDHGVAVVLANPFVRFDSVASLVGSRSFRLTSAFRPTFNMAANLVQTHSRRESQHLLNLSLAQYQSDREVVHLERRRQRLEAELAAMDEDLDALPPAKEMETILEGFELGDLVQIETHGFKGVVGVVSRAHRAKGLKLSGVTGEADTVGFGANHLLKEPVRCGRIDLPVPYVPQRRDFINEVAHRVAVNTPREMLNMPMDTRTAAGVTSNRQAARLRRDINQIVERQAASSGTVGRRFQDVLALLEERQFCDGWNLTDKGALLRGVFHELDLVICECLWLGLFDELPAAELAALLSVFVYESRSRDETPSEWFPNRELAKRWQQIRQMADSIARASEDFSLPAGREVDSSFAANVWAWANGDSFSESVGDDLLSGGDFVRNIRQIIDLLQQVLEIAPQQATRTRAEEAVKLLDRGIVRIAAGVV